jgi:hypothetical protein
VVASSTRHVVLLPPDWRPMITTRGFTFGQCGAADRCNAAFGHAVESKKKAPF